MAGRASRADTGVVERGHREACRAPMARLARRRRLQVIIGLAERRHSVVTRGACFTRSGRRDEVVIEANLAPVLRAVAPLAEVSRRGMLWRLANRNGAVVTSGALRRCPFELSAFVATLAFGASVCAKEGKAGVGMIESLRAIVLCMDNRDRCHQAQRTEARSDNPQTRSIMLHSSPNKKCACARMRPGTSIRASGSCFIWIRRRRQLFTRASALAGLECVFQCLRNGRSKRKRTVVLNTSNAAVSPPSD